MSGGEERLLRLLRYADSAFPSGAVSFSGGLEGLRNDGRLDDEEALRESLLELLAGRFLPFDRLLLAAAWRRAPDTTELAALDHLAESASPAAELRQASRRAGNALLSVHRRLRTSGAAALAEAVVEGGALGHLPVVQGMAWRGVGLSRDEALAAAAHGLIASSVGAAVRLGVIGHLGAQRLHGEMAEWLAPRLVGEPPPVEQLSGAATLLDIAAMRHETQASRLFAS